MKCLIVRHPRARRLTLRLSGDELRLTVPAATGEREVTRFLDAQAEWIAAQVSDRGRAVPWEPRDGDELALLDEGLTLSLRNTGSIGARRLDQRLSVRPSARTGAAHTIERWYRREAGSRLRAIAEEVARRLGVVVSSVSIRDQRGRWGSCSAEGRLSLSWRLLLAPEAIARHVVTHEICHILHPDHSPAFWRALREVDPATDAARAWLTEHGWRLHSGPNWRRLAPPQALPRAEEARG